MTETETETKIETAPAGQIAAPPDHLALVADMTRDFAESRDIDSALARGLARIAARLNAEAASAFVLDAETEQLICRACTGPVDIKGLRLSADHGILGRTVRAGTPQRVTDTDSDPDFGAEVDRQTGFTTRTILAAPLRVQAETLGAIELVNKRGGRDFDADDARSLETLAAAAGLALINARNAEAMAAQAALQRELALAAAIQKRFLPPCQAAAFPVHGGNIPAREVSGDFFDIVVRDSGAIWFALGDVAGKGVNAALLMARTTSLFRYLARTAESPARVLAALNAELLESASHGMFVTMICGVYEPDSATATLANAGHEAALVLGPAGGAGAQWLPAQTPPLGLQDAPFADGNAPAGEDISLAGRRLYLFSDGLSETRDADGRFLGATGVAERLAEAEAAGLGGPALIDRVLAGFLPDGQAPRDDLTLLCVRGGPA